MKVVPSLLLVEHVRKHLPVLKAFMLEQGELFERGFDRLQLGKESSRPKDHLVLHRRRMVILTNPSLVQRERSKFEQKNAARLRAEDKKG